MSTADSEQRRGVVSLNDEDGVRGIVVETLAKEQDVQIPLCVDNAEHAIAIVSEHQQRWLTAQAAVSANASHSS